jgi:hypothetical protein
MPGGHKLIVKGVVIARRPWCHVLVVGFFLSKGGTWLFVSYLMYVVPICKRVMYVLVYLMYLWPPQYMHSSNLIQPDPIRYWPFQSDPTLRTHPIQNSTPSISNVLRFRVFFVPWGVRILRLHYDPMRLAGRLRRSALAPPSPNHAHMYDEWSAFYVCHLVQQWLARLWL